MYWVSKRLNRKIYTGSGEEKNTPVEIDEIYDFASVAHLMDSNMMTQK